ncbi:hypothetical protein M8C21_003550 [Ambrosia artemisiifolia]|uniref:Peptidase A1 domain-containing protein n=1 Tax=Ambrosia artemisiifolia TaxID=4212 RepID=A0AAD5GI20_AMBAR|nr:hypothetical protein M8C21_003550 [Ambrosia artemisiifolia]
MKESFNVRIPVLGLTGVVVLVLLQAVVGDFPATLRLERAFPANHRIELGELKNRDGLRHRRILQQQSLPDVVDFPVDGTYDPYRVGLYYTKVQLGSPPRDYYVQIDTGSDVLWVSCTPCNGCPTTSGLQIPMEFYDPSSSSTSSVISCSDQRCSQASRSSDSGCNNKQCSYTFQYGDGSGTSGYYVSDYMHLNTIGLDSGTSNSSANVVFGCSTSQTGDLTKSDRAVEGIFGFGQNGLSIVSQLSSQGIAPDSFSHCLVGSGSGGGILVIGQILDPNMVFTPLVQSQPHYNVNLQSISVNGQTLPIDPSTFEISDNQGGTIIDSGTTLAYLAEAAYTPFVDAVTYDVIFSVSSIFPTVSLNFAGGAIMRLRPQDYLLQQNSVNGAEVWCIGFQTISNQGITILGDLVLKDKAIVYDLGGQRIGWSDYDCSSSVNVSSTSRGGRSEVVNAGQFNAGTSLQITRYELTMALILASTLHLVMTVRGFSL